MTYQSFGRTRSLVALAIAGVIGNEGRAGAQEATGDRAALALRSSVVKVTATMPSNSVPRTGFGFIVGQQGGLLVVVTADHVVRGDDPGAEDKNPMITFFQKQGAQTRGDLQSTNLPPDRGDLAVILVTQPSAFTFPFAAQSSTPLTRGQPVWLIGRGGTWNVPVNPGRVREIEPFNNRIKVEGLAAWAGSSGGPLVADDGIAGMIVSDSQQEAEATPIGAIQRQVHDLWQYPWQLTNVVPMPSNRPELQTPPTSATTRPLPTGRSGPSFDCNRASHPIEFLVCGDPELANLDLRLGAAYDIAKEKLGGEALKQLKRDEVSWLDARNACITSSEVSSCVKTAYESRILDLNYRY